MLLTIIYKVISSELNVLREITYAIESENPKLYYLKEFQSIKKHFKINVLFKYF